MRRVSALDDLRELTAARRSGLLRALERIGIPAIPIVVLGLTVFEAHRLALLGIDFRHVSGAVRGLPSGRSPYAVDGLVTGTHFIWTILAGWMVLPFAELPDGYLIVVLLEAVGVAAAAVLLGVRDWRLVAVALAWPTTVSSVQTGNITVLVLVLLAATWCDRGRPRAGLWAGLAVGVKLFAWPALVWLAATRRWRALGIGLLVQVLVLAVTLPYISIRTYVRFERSVDSVLAPQSITPDAVARYLGASPVAGEAVALLIGLTILVWGRRDLGWVTVAMLALSPVAWLHYYGLLMIPLALWAPSLGVWFLPMLLVVGPGTPNGGLRKTAATLAVVAFIVGCAWLSGRRRRERPDEHDLDGRVVGRRDEHLDRNLGEPDMRDRLVLREHLHGDLANTSG